jgi:hypothetical protein
MRMEILEEMCKEVYLTFTSSVGHCEAIDEVVGVIPFTHWKHARTSGLEAKLWANPVLTQNCISNCTG